MANFSATKGRVFKQCATKGRVLNTKCVPERVWFFALVVPGTVQNVKICTKHAKLAKLAPIIVPMNHFRTLIVPQRVPFLWICASKGIGLGPNFVPVRVGFGKFCATKGRGFTLPS